MAGCSRPSLRPPPTITTFARTNGQHRLSWTPYPAAEQYRVLSGTSLAGPLVEDTNGAVAGFTWSRPEEGGNRFYQVAVTPLASNGLLTANVLNRLAYGPTPDDLKRLAIVGPQAYIEEQLAPETITETSDAYVSQTTNGVALGPATNWTSVVVTGRVTSSTLYVYLTTPGDVFLDDVQLRLIQTVYQTNVVGTNLVVTTNTVLGPNVLVNGGFENGTSGWTISANHAASAVDTNHFYEGDASLHVVATAGGSTQGSSIWQTVSPALPTAGQQRCVLSFRYLQNQHSDKLVLRLSGSGTISSGTEPPPTPTWIYATTTGTATSTRTLYIYLSGAGEAFIDDIKLVAGTVPEAGPNLLQNGDFESPLTGPWTLTANFTNSAISRAVSHSGAGSLKIVATAGGSGSGNAIYQANIAGLNNGQTYTVSFWYIPSTRNRTLTVRLSGSQLLAQPDTTLAGLRRRLDTFGGAHVETGQITAQTVNGAGLADLRAWFLMNAVGSRRQLLEVLTQFLENHFVTEHAKSMDYLDRYYDDTGLRERIATDWEYREMSKWRAALLRPDCTFYDLLKISAESPAMIVYLDTVDSRGDGNRIANENYARELFELFCMGVDNGYDQNDIVAMSRAWTGWSVDLLDRENVDNPLAPPSTTYGFYPGVGYDAVSNKVGVWTFRYKAQYHGTNRAPILSVWDPASTPTNLIARGPKIVPARFGPPWAGTPYQLVLPRRPTNDTNSIQDGYDVIRHLANLPMTMEYISVKLCRLFVHDGFPNPTTHEDLPEYHFYDYTRPDLSPEARLVRDCMWAWWNATPRGNLRAVLQTIFNSELFRSHGGSLHKVKTPLEFAASTVRALRSARPDGTFTASTDGYSIVGRDRTASSAPLTRMGRMMLFDRDSPDGYPEDGPPWISAGTLAERLRFVQAVLLPNTDTNRNDGINGNNNTFTDPVGLLKKELSSTRWRDATAVSAYFLSILFPGEGAGNLALYRDLAVNFLNTADDGVTASPFASLGDTSSAYDTRVRGMVALLMTLPRFQEQ